MSVKALMTAIWGLLDTEISSQIISEVSYVFIEIQVPHHK